MTPSMTLDKFSHNRLLVFNSAFPYPADEPFFDLQYAPCRVKQILSPHIDKPPKKEKLPKRNALAQKVYLVDSYGSCGVKMGSDYVKTIFVVIQSR